VESHVFLEIISWKTNAWKANQVFPSDTGDTSSQQTKA